MMQRKLTSHELVSGMASRKYRRKLAACSVKPSDSMLTLKFRLDHAEGLQDRVPFDRFRQLYDVVEDVGKGSLTHYLFTAILSGFRIFASGNDARTFASRKIFRDAEFHDALLSATGLDLPSFIPSLIKKRLATEVRATGGKDNRFCKEVIVREYSKTLATKLPTKTDESKVNELFSYIADAILEDDDLKSWNDLKNAPKKAFQAVDKAMIRFCGKDKIPSIASMLSSGDSELPNNTTIAFDDKSIHINADTPYAPYFVVATILRHFKGDRTNNTELRKYVQDNLTTNTNSGLSWFFGVGLNLLKTKSIDYLCKGYGIPPSRRNSMVQLQDAAKAIPNQTMLFSGKNALSLAVFRSALGGHLDSWVANYINRLNELKTLLQKMPDSLTVPDALVRGKEDFLDTTNCSRTDINLLLEQVNGDYFKQTIKALNNLLGQSKEASATDIQKIESCTEQLNQLSAFYRQVANAIDQASKDKDSAWHSLKDETKDSWEDWDKIKTLPKLNQMTGGVPDAKKELDLATKNFSYLLKAQKNYFEQIKAWAEANNCPLVPLEILTKRQQDALNKRPGVLHNVKSAEEMAIRQILNRIGNTVRVCSDAFAGTIIQWFISNGIFTNERDRNRYFVNRLGGLYFSPFSTNSHQPYPVRNDLVESAPELFQSLGAMLEDISIIDTLDSDAQDTFLKLNRLWLAFQLSGLTQPVPAKIAALDIPEDMERSIPADLKFRDSSADVPASSVCRLFNLYASQLSGLQIVLRRSRFYLRSKFSWVGNNVLYYVPKAKDWMMPERYRNSNAWKPIFENDDDVLCYKENGIIDPLKTFQNILDLPAEKQVLMKPLLIQLPHDWCYSLPFVGEKTSTQTVLQIEKKGAKGTVLTRKELSPDGLARLIGPSSMKGQLDELIVNPSHVTVSDMTLLIDQPVIQKKKEDGHINLEYKPYELTLAIPIARTSLKADEGTKLPFKRIVAIDQGEAGLAYAVFDLDDIGNSTAEPVASGTLRIPSIRRLIKGVKHFRKAGQKTQKFNQRFDSTMFTLRENVTGDVCGIIVGLMQRYQAFPILENQVKNLESGSKQLSLVYKAVNARFLYSDVPMQNSEREAWWYKGNYWALPALYRLVPQAENNRSVKNTIKHNGQTYRPLNVFPGASVNAWMTSRICSCCDRNVWAMIRVAEDAGIKSFIVKKGGEIDIGGETIKLYDHPDSSLRRYFARRNERMPLNVPIKEGHISIEELKSRVRRNLRRPPKSLQSKDTTQSRYFCVFKDCSAHNKERHADINAAINIGRRFLHDVFRKDK